jgi:hypothetical protein
LLVHFSRKERLNDNNDIKMNSLSFKSVRKLYSELLLTSKKRSNSRKLTVFNKPTSLRFTNILGNFKNLERYKTSKNNFFSFYFNLNNTLRLPLNKLYQSTSNMFIVRGLFYLTNTGVKSINNMLLSPSTINYPHVPIFNVTKLNLLFSHTLHKYNLSEPKQNTDFL